MNKIQILTMTDDKLDKAIKIQGTKYDRKRKISDKTVKTMFKMLAKGKTNSQVARELGVSVCAVRYNTDPAFKKVFNATRDGRHTGKDNITVKDRVAYKRQLVAAGKVSC